MGDRPSLRNNHEGVGSIEEGQRKIAELLTGKPRLNENKASSGIIEKGEAKSIEIQEENAGGPVAFVADGDYIINGDGNKIRRRQVKDGQEVGQPMDAGRAVLSIGVSRDGNWIVSGAEDGHVTVWDAEIHAKAMKFRGRKGAVLGVDISPDGKRIATGSSDRTVCVWSLSTGGQLLGPFKHDDGVTAVKFSPDGHRIATATLDCQSVRIYDSHDGRLLVDTPIQVGSLYNQSLAWTGLGKELLALSHDGNIHCIDVTTGTTHSKWAIHSNDDPKCIALTNDDAFIAASANSSVSFWDIATHKEIGPRIHHPYDVSYMAISANNILAISGFEKMILQKLPNIPASSYFDHVCVFSPKPHAKETLFTANHLQQQPEALRTSSEERRPEETVSFHHTKDQHSSESSLQEVSVQSLAIKELPPPITGEKEQNTDINNIQSNFPHDLTGHVIRSSGLPNASGSYGDIYKGTLNVRGGSIDVCHCLFS